MENDRVGRFAGAQTGQLLLLLCVLYVYYADYHYYDVTGLSLTGEAAVSQGNACRASRS